MRSPRHPLTAALARAARGFEKRGWSIGKAIAISLKQPRMKQETENPLLGGVPDREASPKEIGRGG
jgi:hypothetical protein